MVFVECGRVRRERANDDDDELLVMNFKLLVVNVTADRLFRKVHQSSKRFGKERESSSHF